MDFSEIGVSLVKVVVVGIALGAGLPALFALGLKGLARTEVGPDGSTVVTARGRAIAGVSFGIVSLAVIVGIIWIISGGH